MRARAPLASGTVVQYNLYRRHVSAVFGHLDPAALTQGDIVRYLKRCPRTSARNEIGLLSLAYVGWIDEERLTFNPCFGVKVGMPVSKRSRLLADGEIDAIVRATGERLAVAIELAYATGLRRTDLCALRWADVAACKETQKTSARQAFEKTDYLGAILARPARCRPALPANTSFATVTGSRGARTACMQHSRQPPKRPASRTPPCTTCARPALRKPTGSGTPRRNFSGTAGRRRRRRTCGIAA